VVDSVPQLVKENLARLASQQGRHAVASQVQRLPACGRKCMRSKGFRNCSVRYGSSPRHGGIRLSSSRCCRKYMNGAGFWQKEARAYAGFPGSQGNWRVGIWVWFSFLLLLVILS